MLQIIKNVIADGGRFIITSSGSFQQAEHKFLEEHHIAYGVINTSVASYVATINKAISFLQIRCQEQAQAEVLQTILNFSGQGIICVDREAKISYFNATAEILTGIPAEKPLNRSFSEVFEKDRDILEKLAKNQLQWRITSAIHNVPIIADIVPLIVGDDPIGTLLTFDAFPSVEAAEQHIRQAKYAKGLQAKHTFADIYGKSNALLSAVQLAKTYSQTESTILISGETGTGKEIFARAIHRFSPRRDKPFLVINCASIPASLLKSELFGYEPRSFSGAKREGKAGYFKLAHNGTIFLDEIGEIDLQLQLRLLRVVQEREIMRVGGTAVIPVDIWIIATTNRNLYTEVQNGSFREVLYFRLNVLSLKISPLRERFSDLPILTDAFLPQINRKLHYKVSGVDKETRKLMEAYDWPGNIRELQNMLEKMVAFTRAGEVKYASVSAFFEQEEHRRDETVAVLFDMTLEEAEKQLILNALREESGNQQRTPKRLGIDRTTLFRKLNRYMIGDSF